MTQNLVPLDTNLIRLLRISYESSLKLQDAAKYQQQAMFSRLGFLLGLWSLFALFWFQLALGMLR